MNSLAGITMNQSQGTMASGLYGCVEQLVLCDEMIHMIRHLLSGFRLDDDTLGLDVIRQVGHGGNFLTEDHTLEHFRKEMFFPGLFRRQSVDEWLSSGARPMVEIAHDRVKEILERKPPVKLPGERERALEEALRRAVQATEREA